MAKILVKSPKLNDEQIILAVYILTKGRAPTDDEMKQAAQKFAASKLDDQFNGEKVPKLLTGEDVRKVADECGKSVRAAAPSNERFIDLTYLLILSRLPTAEEAKQLAPQLTNAAAPETVAADIFMALLNLREFFATA